MNFKSNNPSFFLARTRQPARLISRKNGQGFIFPACTIAFNPPRIFSSNVFLPMNRFFQILPFLFFAVLATAQTDTIPPTINCPPHDTVTLPANVCTFQYFYAISANDLQSEVTIEQLSGLVSGSEFPLGNTVNVFVAADSSGNSATCSFQLTVQNFAGQLNCKTNLTVSLDSTCSWQPDPAILLNGNFGCLDSGTYVVELDKTPPSGNGPWEPADIGPDDAGKTYAFRVTETDYGGSCTGNLQINDMLPPILLCEGFLISCAVDDLSPTFLKDSLGIAAAMPFAEDACGPLSLLIHQDMEIPAPCDSPFTRITNRRWTAQDQHGNSSTCIQSIQLARIQFSDLILPSDLTLSCANPDISMENTGQPYTEYAGRQLTDLCSLGANPTDTVIQICPGSYRVQRTWAILDWCSGQIFDTIQIIDIEDKTGPVFQSCPPDVTVSATTTNCLADVDLPDLVVADACSYLSDVKAFWKINNVADTLTATLTDFPGNDMSLPDTLAQFGVASGFPSGIFGVSYVATDNCGNTSKCDFALHVWDSVPPVASCLDFIEIVFSGTTGLATIDAETLNNGSHDDCGTLTFKVRRLDDSPCVPDTLFYDSVNFCCYEIGDTIEVLLRVYDVFVPNGSISASFAEAQSGGCITRVVAQDPDDACVISPFMPILGAIRTETTDGVNKVAISLNIHAPTGLVLQTQTDAFGQFLFSNVPPGTTDYTLTPFKDNNHLDGVSTYDLVLISKHILGLDYLDTPYKIIAADANHSESVTTFDIVEIRKLILGIYDDFPDNTSWRFVDKTFMFPNPANPFQSAFPESIFHTDTMPAILDHDFEGVKIGDVNNTTLGDNLFSSDDRSRGVLFFDVKNRDVRAGETFTVDFKAAEKVSGYQFTLNVEGLEIIKVEPGKGMGTGNFGIFPNAVTAAVETGARAFSIAFRSRKSGQLSEMLHISSRITRAEAYGAIKGHYSYWSHYSHSAPNDPNDPNNSLLDVALRFDDGRISQNGFELYPNQPNPFRDKTRIGFYLPENADATLTVFDETGRVRHTQSGHYAQGHHVILLEQHLLGDAGVLFYKLETAADSAVRKMVRMR